MRPTPCSIRVLTPLSFFPPSSVFPMFKTLRGVEALAAKAKEDFTLEDVRTDCTRSRDASTLFPPPYPFPSLPFPSLPPAQSMSVLASYRNFVTTALKGVKDMADPVRLATTMNEYSDAVAPQTLQVRPSVHPPTFLVSSVFFKTHPPTHPPTHSRPMARTVP